MAFKQYLKSQKDIFLPNLVEFIIFVTLIIMTAVTDSLIMLVVSIFSYPAVMIMVTIYIAYRGVTYHQGEWTFKIVLFIKILLIIGFGILSTGLGSGLAWR